MTDTGRLDGDLSRRAGVVLVLLSLTLVGPGCRSMSTAPRSVPDSPTFQTAVGFDPEPHVLSVTIHAPTPRWDYSSPRAMSWSAVRGGVGEVMNAGFETFTGRTLGYHMLGHVSIELKSVDPETGAVRYLLTASTSVDDSETIELVARQQIGYSVVERGTAGRLQSPEEVARDVDESAEIGVPAARLRVLVSPAAAERMLQFFEEFQQRRIYENYSLTAYPLNGDGSGCTALAVSFLDVAGLLEPEWRERWQVVLRIPEALFGDPDLGTRVPLRAGLFGPVTRRWAAPDEAHRLIAFYDTTAMYQWARALACAPPANLPLGFTNDDPVTREIGRRLDMPVLTIDRRASPTPVGPVFTGSPGPAATRGAARPTATRSCPDTGPRPTRPPAGTPASWRPPASGLGGGPGTPARRLEHRSGTASVHRLGP